MNGNVVRAIFRRNLVGYFNNPTGYVFICMFVLLTGFAAFWPNEFFNSNLANLNQLNKYLPFIMLVFIPAITMSIWSEERRQGTDELLLTIPAADLDVVVGKYLAAVAIYSIALLFSLSNVLVLRFLGSPDIGLMAATYIGYWFLGLTMLAIGMVASFLTRNLTVGFVLGAAFNAPLAFAASSDVIVRNAELTNAIKRWSFTGRLSDFGRGVISVSGLLYFVLLAMFCLYICMVLIGRRHWTGGSKGNALAGHYTARILSLLLLVIGLIALSTRFDYRYDMTAEKLSSLAEQTKQLVRNLKTDRPVVIEAFISPEVPESYVTKRLDLISMLNEIDSLGGNKIRLTIYNTEPLSDIAVRADKQFGIKGNPVLDRQRGAWRETEIYLGVAITCGLEKIVIPFFGRGTPVEYELLRSIATVTDETKLKIGVVVTDAKLYGSFDMQSMRPTRNQRLIDELEKQYDVEQVQISADQPISDEYDALLVVQPSSLTDPQLDQLLATIRGGMPTAIFEDPMPLMDGSVPGTNAPRRPQGGGMMGMQPQPPEPKGRIARLWQLLGISFNGGDVVAHDYQPYPRYANLMGPEWVFVDDGMSGEKQPFSDEDEVTAGLQQMVFPYAGSLTKLNDVKEDLEFRRLVLTSPDTRLAEVEDLMTSGPFGMQRPNPDPRRRPVGENLVLVARIKGQLSEEAMQEMPASHPALMPNMNRGPGAPGFGAQGFGSQAEGPDVEDSADEGSDAQPFPPAGTGEPAADPPSTDAPKSGPPTNNESASGAPGHSPATPTDPAAQSVKDSSAQDAADEKPHHKAGLIDVIVVADIDLLYDPFFALREQGQDPNAEDFFDLDNVPFTLNVLDSLAGEPRFIDVRKRRREHRSLARIERWTNHAREQAEEQRQEFKDEFKKKIENEQEALNEKVEKIRERDDLDQLTKNIMTKTAENRGTRRVAARTLQLEQERDSNIKRIDRDLEMQVRTLQHRCKMAAVLLPPILPLSLAAVVFFMRRSREREGVSRNRLR
jgi:ABC-2 type transport system permease protein